uniref:Regulation of nuclear pre-mRNA domain-containing protein 1B-like isoform X2 n=1 Tax=Petromyzon marinus TaxID=7757 RepID=A0AAJ7U8L1_PETMA|nr:regulation of nuclear pre-mRNA domain-containing protein 1B-like isoform X2 [Petromyzon marinus]
MMVMMNGAMGDTRVVCTWTAKPSRKLTFLYLANDVIQNSKKKGPEFGRDFGPVLVDAFGHVAREAEDSCKRPMERVLAIWQERAVFEADFIDQIRRAIGSLPGGDAPKKAAPDVSRQAEEKRPPPVAAGHASGNGGDKKAAKRRHEQVQVAKTEEEDDDDYLVNCSPREPPETEELIKALQELEQAASGDAAVRRRIAALPPEVQDPSLLSKIKDAPSAERLSRMVEEACVLLADYNGRLAAELDDRKQLARMLANYLRSQKELLAQKERKLEEYKQKLAKVTLVRKELRTHIQNLPDFSKLPASTKGLAPLPSAGDLFSKD